MVWKFHLTSWMSNWLNHIHSTSRWLPNWLIDIHMKSGFMDVKLISLWPFNIKVDVDLASWCPFDINVDVKLTFYVHLTSSCMLNICKWDDECWFNNIVYVKWLVKLDDGLSLHINMTSKWTYVWDNECCQIN